MSEDLKALCNDAFVKSGMSRAFIGAGWLIQPDVLDAEYSIEYRSPQSDLKMMMSGDV